MNVNWTNDLIFQLIDFYCERRLLWDHDIPDYKDKVKKHETWQEIADIMNISKEVVMRKMKILTTQFQREYARSRHRPVEEGSKWFAYTRLLFLSPNVATRTSTTPPTTLNQYEHYQVSPVPDEHIIEVKQEAEDMSEDESSVSGRKRPVAVAVASPPSSRDEYAVYGEYVALKLRNLTDPYTRHTAQQQINDVLFQAQMENISQ